MTQAVFGERYGIGIQSAVSQFLKGTTPLSLSAANGFVQGLNEAGHSISLEDISPRLYKQAISMSAVIPSHRLSDGEIHQSAARLYRAAKEMRGIEGQSEIARLLDEFPQTVKNWESRGVSVGGALKAQSRIGCDANWLLNGTGAMKFYKATEMAVSEIEVPDDEHQHTVFPLLNIAGSMGPGEDQHDEVVVGRLTVAPGWIEKRLKPFTKKENLKFIHGFGDSMSPTFEDGSILLVDGGVRTVDIDGIYVLEANQRVYIKRVRQRIDGAYEVSSDNPTVKTVDVLNGNSGHVNILGRVLWLWNGKKV